MPLVPVLYRPRLREQGGLPRRPLGGGAAQVDPCGCVDGVRGGSHRKPCPPFALAQEYRVVARPAGQRRAIQRQRLRIRIGHRKAGFVQSDQAGPRPRGRQRSRVIAQMVGAVQRAIDERERRCGPHPPAAHTVKLLPQPQVVLALGLRITNCAPASDSL